MRITKADVIKNGEQDLMDAISADLDWGAIERVFREKHHLNIEEDVEYKGGDMVVHNDHVAYRLEFIARVTLSVLLDREGNYLSVSTAEVPGKAEGQGPEDMPPADETAQSTSGEGLLQVLSELAPDETPEDPTTPSLKEPEERVALMLSRAAEMITDLEGDQGIATKAG
jgi:hypothetical protein